MKIDAIVADLDGTLLNSDKIVSENDIQTLKFLGEKNIVRIVATGRSFYGCKQVLDNNFPIDFLIFSAGAGIMNYKTKEIFYSKYLKRTDVIFISKILTKKKIDFQVRLKVPEGHKYYYRRFYDQNSDFDYLNNKHSQYIKFLRNVNILPDATRIIAISPEADSIDFIFNKFSDFGLMRATSPLNNKTFWIEIFPKEVNKGSALQFLAERLNIKLENILGLGNDFNDIDFLDITGKSFMVENAAEILKSKYNVTVSHNHSPLHEIISLNYSSSNSL